MDKDLPRRAAVTGAVIGLLALVGCGTGESTGVSAGPGSSITGTSLGEDPEPGYVVKGLPESEGTFSSLADMKEQSEVVALFEVVGEREGEVTNESVHARSSQRILELRVIEGFTGVAEGDRIDLWDAIYDYDLSRDDPSPVALTVSTETYNLRPGQQVILGLFADPSFEDQFGIVSPSSFFVVDQQGQGFLDVERLNRRADEVETRSLADVLAELRA